MKMPALALLTLAASFAVPGALAQGVVLKAHVPFSFTVGTTYLPSGEYIISTPLSGVVRIENTENHRVATVSTSRAYHESDRGNKLVFERYGAVYFLHRILCPMTTQMNVDLPRGKLEKRARSREAMFETGEQVLVAAR
jgi:hypothetical protein